MKVSKLTLSVLPQELAVCRLSSKAFIPEWIEGSGFLSITRTDEELSIVCDGDLVPDGIKAEKGWKAFKVEGPLDFSLTGVLASLANPLAEADISIFAVSTYDTDYLLVRCEDFENAYKELEPFCTFKK